MKRRGFVAVLGGAAAISPLLTYAQVAERGRRIGFLHPGRTDSANSRIEAFREGLRGGSSEAHLDIVARAAEGRPERLPALARDLVAEGVAVIIAVSPSGMSAARDATQSISIVGVDLNSDPVATGWAASLARPGGNVTGIFLDLPEVSVKCLQLLREFVPSLSRVGVLWDPAAGSLQLKAVQAAMLGVDAVAVPVSRAADLEHAFHSIRGAGGVLLLSSPLFSGNLQAIAKLALKHRLPAITLFPEFAQNGGLAGYGPELQALFRQAGVMARKVLEGARPADLPVERPSTFQLAVNLKTAALLGVTVPTSILLRANEVIE
jgi:putative ABC transport system substrate-binding protein